LEEGGIDTFLKNGKEQNSKELSENGGRKNLPRRKTGVKIQTTG
jgi:hypothetical protein